MRHKPVGVLAHSTLIHNPKQASLSESGAAITRSVATLRLFLVTATLRPVLGHIKLQRPAGLYPLSCSHCRICIYIYTHRHIRGWYSALPVSELMPFEGTQKDLPMIILDEVQSDTGRQGRRVSVIDDGTYKLTQKNTFTKDKDTVLETPLRVTKGEKDRGWGGEGLIRTLGLTYIHTQISLRASTRACVTAQGTLLSTLIPYGGKTPPKDDIHLPYQVAAHLQQTPTLEINYISNKIFNFKNKMNCLLYSSGLCEPSCCHIPGV